MSSNRTNLFVKVAVSVMVIVCLVTILRLQIQFNQLNEDRKELEAQVKAYAADIEELQAELDTPFDDEYIIRVAREKLGYHLPDEIIYYNDLN
ncbi:MAG: septum formation initiator family protein [Clostridia bacterium]|nr:septum formation initiator family protein [Clostridia bacterium]